MQIVLASGNKGKLREFGMMMDGMSIIPYSELIGEMDIIEDGDTFAANALIKARAVYRGLTSDDMSARKADLSSAGLTHLRRSSSRRNNYQSTDDTAPNKFGVPEKGQMIHNSSLRDKTQNTRPLTTPTNDYIVIADDSGISVPALGGEPGIYSARYAGEGASDKDNLYKLIDTLKARAIKRTPAYYTAAIAIVSKYGEFVVHGWMYGDVIRQARGDKGFGYDPMFVPYRGLTSDDMSAQRADLSSAGLTPLMLMMTSDDMSAQRADLSSAGLTPLVEQGAGSKEQLAVSSEQLKGKTLGELDDDVKSAISHRAKALELAKPIIEMLHRR